ncbi:cytochrome P450 [Burkholderia alba]|uniref:cytochrome P450 n=1 Tax=Burkholderia alba TaxID=2683677 RepID=UPI002B057317|nr:cytochrome P450 [Burkholderia alba]
MNFSTFSSPAFFADPYPLYAQLRAKGPLLEIAPNIRVTGDYALINALLRERSVGKTYLQSVRVRYGEARMGMPVFDVLSRMFLMMNPPAHTRLRTLLMKAFNARQIENLRAITEASTRELLDAIAGKAEFDLVADYALPLPLNIICRLLGIPFDDGARLGQAASRVASALDLAPIDDARLQEANDGALALEAYFEDVIERRRRRPGDDLISSLLTVEDDGETFNKKEVIANVVLLFVAGHETTSNTMSNAMVALFRNPERLAELIAAPSLVPSGVAECMRYDSSVQMVVRTVFEDIRVEGHVLPRGTLIFMLLGAANRDPAVFPDPDRLDIHRVNAKAALTFGGGIHYCLGARLAQMELEIAIGSLLQRFPSLRPIDLDRLEWHQRNNLRGLQTLRIGVA